MPSLRIVYVMNGDYPWDVRTEKICAALTDAGHEVHIVARNRAWRPRKERFAEGSVHRMRPWRWIGRRADTLLGFPAFFSPRWRGLVSRVVRDTRADVIIARDLPLCPTALAAGRRYRVPVIFDMAEHYPAVMRELWTSSRHRPLDYLVRNPTAVERVERYCLSRVDHVFTVVEESSDRLIAHGVPATRISVVGNTPPRARAEQPGHPAANREGAAAGAIDLVYLGIFEVSRGLLDVLDACRLLADESPAVRALLIGNGRDEQLVRDHARVIGLRDDQVVFFGYVPYADALQIVARADVGLLPMHLNEHMHTTLPNKLFDYMSLGIPVLTSDSRPSARVVRDVRCGEVFRAASAADLAAAVRRLRDPAVRRAMGEAGRAAVLDRYHWELDARVMLASIDRVVDAFRARETREAVSRR